MAIFKGIFGGILAIGLACILIVLYFIFYFALILVLGSIIPAVNSEITWYIGFILCAILGIGTTYEILTKQ